MGKGRKNKPKKNFAEKRREKRRLKNEWDIMPQRSYADIIRENKDFEHYYKTQGIMPEDKWDAFLTTMRKNLPAAFRITGSKSEAKPLLDIIKSDFFKDILNTKLEEDQENDDDEKKTILHCLPFYPEELAWQLQLTRKDIRRSETYFKLHNFLIAETNSGSISRQEVVSMIPPLVLDVKSWHKVLDMCAAPGSKTAQLIEMIHADEGNTTPDGFVIANDLDNNRCYMLVHQAKRLNSPSILITNHDASVLPNFTITKEDGTQDTLKFDRILADVPCSGDGTMRKNPDIWCKWSPANGNNLHGIQYRIAKRGLELLAVGGRMVYSTCSLNPVENEAVLHRLLQETQDSVQIIDCRNLVPGLVCDPGITNWVLATKNLQYYKSWEEVPEQWQTQIRPKMFPPHADDVSKFHLERCMRILPHHQDTGGFFVAVLEKIKPLPWENESSTSDQTVDNSVNENKEELSLEEEVEKEGNTLGKKKRSLEEQKKSGPQRKRKRKLGYREDPFIFFKNDTEDVWQSIKEFYNISNDLDPRYLLVRCNTGRKRNIYFTSPAIRDIVISNMNNVKMINTGVKTFVRCDNKNMTCAFRLAQEGMHSIFQYIGDNRKLRVAKEDLILLLQNNNPHTPPEIIKLQADTQKRLKDFATGSCILQYSEDNKENPLKIDMVGWRGTMSLRAYVPIPVVIHYLRLLGADYSMFEKNKFKDRISLSEEANDEEMTNENIIQKEVTENGTSLQEVESQEVELQRIKSKEAESKEVESKEAESQEVELEKVTSEEAESHDSKEINETQENS